VDFSCIKELLADSYCAKFGRPAKEPEMMMKLLFFTVCIHIIRHISAGSRDKSSGIFAVV
jgi:hypothetical protein